MLPIHILSKNNVRSYNVVLFQWLNVPVRLCSSSSNSSDSDSDDKKSKRKRIYVKNAEPNKDTNLEGFLNNMIEKKLTSTVARNIKNTRFNEMDNSKTAETDTGSSDLLTYVNNMIKERKLQKTVNVAMHPKRKSDISKNIANQKRVPYENKLINAAKDVATALGGDEKKTTSDLLEKILSYKTESSKEDKRSINKNDIKLDEKPLEPISTLWNTAKMKQSKEYEEKETFTNKRISEKKSVIQSLLNDYQLQKTTAPKKTAKIVENSLSRQLLSNYRMSTKQPRKNDKTEFHAGQKIDIWNGVPNSIFDNIGIISPNTPELRTWRALEQRELKAFTTNPPANVFQELILWTEQGKLWKFPIDNEQGMEEEQNVHFSEHVFMERHLKGWCPKLGPIRHFMELVCNGLSKNPYMTVQEKINHIMWYKEYFESKEDILQKIGAIQEPFPGKIKITE